MCSHHVIVKFYRRYEVVELLLDRVFAFHLEFSEVPCVRDLERGGLSRLGSTVPVTRLMSSILLPSFLKESSLFLGSLFNHLSCCFGFLALSEPSFFEELLFYPLLLGLQPLLDEGLGLEGLTEAYVFLCHSAPLRSLTL